LIYLYTEEEKRKFDEAKKALNKQAENPEVIEEKIIIPSCKCGHRKPRHSDIVIDGWDVKENQGTCLEVLSFEQEIIPYKGLNGERRERLVVVNMKYCGCLNFRLSE
jgi:hypothetical protein